MKKLELYYFYKWGLFSVTRFKVYEHKEFIDFKFKITCLKDKVFSVLMFNSYKVLHKKLQNNIKDFIV